MPGIVKIGYSRDPAARAAQLSAGTGVPTPFRIVYRVKAADAPGLEATIHRSLSSVRVARSREFFRLEPREARALVRRHALRHNEAERRWLLVSAVTACGSLAFKLAISIMLVLMLLHASDRRAGASPTADRSAILRSTAAREGMAVCAPYAASDSAAAAAANCPASGACSPQSRCAV